FSGLVRVIVTGGACYGGYVLGGVPGFILGVAVGALAEHVFDHAVLLRHGINFLSQDVAWFAAFAAVGLTGYIATIEASALFDEPTEQIIAGAVASVVVMLIVGVWTAWKVLPLVLNGKAK
ncbi:MAG: hypothetical protein ACOC0P_02390, partial [Planctomycetota bacterium]